MNCYNHASGAGLIAQSITVLRTQPSEREREERGGGKEEMMYNIKGSNE